jgi:HAMP domain-containing protein
MIQATGGISLPMVIKRDVVVLLAVVWLVMSCVAYYHTRSMIQDKFEQKGYFLATSLSDAAAGHILSKNVLQLDTILAKYGRLEGVAYALVQDRDGKVVANSLRTASEWQGSIELEEERSDGLGSTKFRGKRTQESRAPILDGRLGTVRVGIWADDIDREIRQEVVTFIVPVAVLCLASAMLAVFVTGRRLRPLDRLTELAAKISMGELDIPVRGQSRHEFGELTNSLERMRASLKAAMMRLGEQ